MMVDPNKQQRREPVEALFVWLAGLLGRPLTQDEGDQLLAIFRQAVLATVKEIKRLVAEDPEAHQ